MPKKSLPKQSLYIVIQNLIRTSLNDHEQMKKFAF